ncbi:MAG: tetratricopeptide repeat protein [Patescibacteria group bacterium]|jgi:tetratricopeptide (TPR) repeat protein
MLYLIPLIIIIISLSIIIFIVVKKFPNLAAINIESIAKEKENKVKNRIMIERLARSYSNLRRATVDISKPLVENIKTTAKDFYQKTLELEKQSLKRNQPLKEIDISGQVKDKLAELEKALAAQEFARAEEIGISIVELDPQNLDVYDYLADVYLGQKDYKKARETCRYLLKLLNKNVSQTEDGSNKHRLANCYADLGWVYQLENKQNFSLSNFQKAVELEPTNPRFLDLLLKMSIILKNKKLAWQAFSDLKAADPGNQKLSELKEEIDSLPDLEK